MRYLIGIIAVQGLLGISMMLHADEGYVNFPDRGEKRKLKNYEYYEDYLKEQEDNNNSNSPYDQEAALRRAFAPTLKKYQGPQL